MPLELAVLTTPPDSEGIRNVDLEGAKEAMLRKSVHYDKAGEEHFNLISALHKSVRGSDPDAALYWLARMLEGGEDPLYLARRIIRMACEDIGLADPAALVQAINAFQAYHFLGSPEGELALAQAVVYLCLAPKSNSLYIAFGTRSGSGQEQWRRPGAFASAKRAHRAYEKTGLRREYKYAHDFEGGWLPEVYMPGELAGMLFFDPKPAGWEARFKDQLEQRRAKVKQLLNKEDSSGK